MVCGSHAKTRAMYSIPPCPSLAASMAAYRRRSFSDNQLKKRCIFPSISAGYPSISYSLLQNLLWSKDTTAPAIREVILDHILRRVMGETCYSPQTVALAQEGQGFDRHQAWATHGLEERVLIGAKGVSTSRTVVTLFNVTEDLD